MAQVDIQLDINEVDDSPLLIDQIDISTPAKFGKVDKVKGLELRRKGLSYADIAKVFSCTPQAAHQAISPLLHRQAVIDTYKEQRADVFADLQLRLLRSVDDTDLKKASALQKVTAAGILYDKERLERGESTANISTLHADIAAIKGHERYRAIKGSDEDTGPDPAKIGT